MTSSRSVVLATPVRTAIGTFGGSLKEVSASDLGAVAIGAAVERAGLEPDEIGTVVMGRSTPGCPYRSRQAITTGSG
jgi:acetyl-CoA C-acetyltransferase